MMGYLDRLKGMNSEKCLPLPLQELQKDPSYSFCSSHGARFQKITPPARPADDSATAYRWWLLHFSDREPVQVVCIPDVSHAEILERHPEAIAAEPTQLQRNHAEPARACSTCTHETRRGGCGEPVAAGLSDVAGVIRYSTDQGATCPAWMATIPGDLEASIRAMAERWDYSGDDLALALAGARADPAGWLRVVEADETEGGE